MSKRKAKPSKLAEALKRAKKVRYRKTGRKGRRNPDGNGDGGGGAVSRFGDELKDAGMELIPIVGSMAGSTVLVRLFDRFMARFANGKLGPLSRHAAVLAWAATLLTAYAATTYVKSLRKYRTPVLVGTALGALVHLLPKYIPALGWMVGQPMLAPGQLPAANGVTSASPTSASASYSGSNGVTSAPQLTAAGGSDEALLMDDEEDLGDVLDPGERDLYAGVFAKRTMG